MNKEQTIKLLNKVIEINNDRIEGYETASKETKNEELINLFFQFIQTSKKCNTELISEVLQLGGTPESRTKTIGKFFRVWMDLKTSLSCNNRKSILSLCEYGENKAIDIYNSVLKNYTALLNIDQQKILTLQLAMIQKDHGTLKDMRNNLIPVTK
jgi:uncharacterized protein (TIGR02284 family)